MEAKLKQEDDKHFRIHKDLEQALRERDQRLEAQQYVHTEQLQKAEEHIVKLQKDMEILAAHAQQAQKDKQDELDQRNKMIQKLCTEVKTSHSGLDKYITETSREMVAKDTEIIALQEGETKLRTELKRSREETERYKQKLSAGLEREKTLEQRQVQLELQWQRHCEDTKAQHYLANEQLIQSLTQARDQANAELRERERELQDITVLLQCVKRERDQALQVRLHLCSSANNNKYF
ncbi:hypothetical protein LDENG_00217740 [Lucifuga dentata]|nr:hypothetical protein LDENG_00217740 [Lucifuga dentata]